MSTYAVRVAKTHEFVGIFWGRSLAHACLRVEEVVEPDACEYKLLAWGGISWPPRDGIEVPRPAAVIKAMDEEDGEIWPSGIDVDFADVMFEPLFHQEDGWMLFDRLTIAAASDIMQESIREIEKQLAAKQ